MKITVRQLKQLIREQVEETVREQTNSSLPVGRPAPEARLAPSIGRPRPETRLAPGHGRPRPETRPAPEATSGTNPRQAELVQSAIQACNLIFQPGIPYSFHSHLTRLKRGLETRDARIANYELASHDAHVTLLSREKYFAIANMFAGPEESVQPWRRGMPAIVPSEAAFRRFLSTGARLRDRVDNVIYGVRDALIIPGVNRGRTMSGWPRDLSTINPRLRMEMISRIQAALTILDSGSDICQLISQGPEALTSTPSTPASESIPTEPEGSDAPMSISERRIRQIKRR